MNDEKLSLRDIQVQANKVLDKLDSVCKLANVKYMLAYGTLIGAVRHNGFIPWDDDVDIWMVREDYDRFLKYCSQHEQDLYPFKLCTRANTLNYPYYISRFANNDYKYITKLSNGVSPDIGIFIDIYPLDEYGKTIEYGKKIEKRIAIQNVLYWAYIEKRSFTGGINAVIRWFVHYLMRLLHGKNYSQVINSKIDKNLNKLRGGSDYLGLPGWETYRIFFPKELFAQTIMHKFENGEYPIPKEYDEILTMIYGDYMKLPPEEKRYPHHEYEVIKRQPISEQK